MACIQIILRNLTLGKFFCLKPISHYRHLLKFTLYPITRIDFQFICRKYALANKKENIFFSAKISRKIFTREIVYECLMRDQRHFSISIFTKCGCTQSLYIMDCIA